MLRQLAEAVAWWMPPTWVAVLAAVKYPGYIPYVDKR